jgi:hypothetical protein
LGEEFQNTIWKLNMINLIGCRVFEEKVGKSVKSENGTPFNLKEQ